MLLANHHPTRMSPFIIVDVAAKAHKRWLGLVPNVHPGLVIAPVGVVLFHHDFVIVPVVASLVPLLEYAVIDEGNRGINLGKSNK